jgi:YbbR domain-containing protein
MKNKLVPALISFGIAVALWFYVVTVVSPNSDKHYNNIPVSIQNGVVLQDRGLMIITSDLPKVSLHLGGNRTDLNKLNNTNITVVADVSKIGAPGTHTLPLTPYFPGEVPNNAITVLSREPGTVTVEVEYRITKDVPVEIVYNGKPAENYLVDKENRELDYEKITVTGPQSVIDQIAMAKIEVDLDGQEESISEQFRYSLCDEKGEPVDAALVTTNTDAVKMTLKIHLVKEINLSVTVVDGGGATQSTAKVAVEPGTIRVSGSKSILEHLDTVDLGTVNLAEIPADTTLALPIKLPEGVNNETGLQEAAVTVQFVNLSTKVLTTTRIDAVNVPEGLAVDFITQRLDIQIRGAKSRINKVEASDLKVTVDFSQGQVGTATVKATITINAEGVGAVGVYNVTATLREK